MTEPDYTAVGPADFGELLDQNDALREQVAVLTKALEAVEWIPTWQDDGDIIPMCPWCRGTLLVRADANWRGTGHLSDCQRQAALALCQGQ